MWFVRYAWTDKTYTIIAMVPPPRGGGRNALRDRHIRSV